MVLRPDLNARSTVVHSALGPALAGRRRARPSVAARAREFSNLAVTMTLLACGSSVARAQTFPELDAAQRQRLAEEARNPVYDSWQRDLMGDLAGVSLAHSGAPSRPDAAPAHSTSLDGSWVLESPPGSRSGHSAVYDPIQERMLVFGGLQGTYLNDVWALSLSGTPIWTKLPVFAAPAPRAGHSAIWDPVRSRMVIFGGVSVGAYLNDSWALSFPPSGPTWTELAKFGTKPPARAYHPAVYDSETDRMRICMGVSAAGGYFEDVWSLAFASNTWVADPIGIIPPGRAQAAVIFDPGRYRMLVFGGVGPFGPSSDCWFYNGGWFFLSTTGSIPSPRYGVSAYRDAANDRMVMFGGRNSSTHFDDVWGLSLSAPATWAAIGASGSLPPGRSAHGAVYVPTQDRLVVHGGSDAGGARNDLWQLDMGGTPEWSELVEPGLPQPRSGHSAVVDLPRQRMLVFGGTNGTTHFDDVEARSLLGEGIWSRVATTGTRPSARANHSALYDPLRDRMLVFGGSNGGAGFNETWALDLSTGPEWSPLATSGTKPAGRSGQAAVLDPARDRMLVFGGRSGAVYLGDVWELTLGATPTWSQLAPSGTPPSARGFQSAIYDPLRDQVVLFGGVGSAGSLADVWVLSLSPSPAWTQLPLVGPSARNLQVAIHDANGDRLVIFGGRDGTTLLDDVWALPLAPGSDWTYLMPENPQFLKPAARREASAIYDLNLDRMVLFGGHTAAGRDQETWSLVWSPRVGVGPPASLAHVWLAPARPTPSRGDVEIAYALPHASAATLAIYDLSGRAVRTLVDGSLPAGPGSIRWDRRTTGGDLAQPGVYFYELNVAGQRQAKRLVLMP